MRKSRKLLSAFVLALLLAIPCMYNMAAEETKTLDVMFVHDTHSHLNEFATVEDGETQVLGDLQKSRQYSTNRKKKMRTHFFWMQVTSLWER